MNRRAPFVGLALILSATTVVGQVDFTGLWRPIPRDSDGSGMIGGAETMYPEYIGRMKTFPLPRTPAPRGVTEGG